MSKLVAFVLVSMFLSASVGIAGETPLLMTKGVRYSSEPRTGSLLPDGQFEHYERQTEKKILVIQSREDSITIKELKLNRGNCDFYGGLLPATLKFGQQLEVIVDCDVIEAAAQTDKGDFDFNWNQ